MSRRVLLAAPRGFCAGVAQAVQIVELALERFGPPVFVRRQIVHKREVVDRLGRMGAVFVEELDSVPEAGVVIFSAHGVAPSVREEAARRNLNVIDATCPLVTKVHREAQRLAEAGITILLVGVPGHDEVVGVQGEAPGLVHVVRAAAELEGIPLPVEGEVAWLSQTTLAVDDTNAVAAGLRRQLPQLIDPPSDPAWLSDVDTVGVTGGASAPESAIASVLERLATLEFAEVEEVTAAREEQVFALPRELWPREL